MYFQNEGRPGPLVSQGPALWKVMETRFRQSRRRQSGVGEESREEERH